MEQQLRVRVLGTTELAVDGRPLAGLASAKATALLVYLAVTGTAQSRSALAGLLWSDLPEATARANLRLALTKLRRALPAQLLVTRQTVALDPARPVWTDAVEVERLAAGQPEGEELLAAARLCRIIVVLTTRRPAASPPATPCSATSRSPSPGALICFAGPRVIEQTIRETLPEGFQRAEYLLDHGMLDRVVARKDLRDELATILRLLTSQPPYVRGDLPAPVEEADGRSVMTRAERPRPRPADRAAPQGHRPLARPHRAAARRARPPRAPAAAGRSTSPAPTARARSSPCSAPASRPPAPASTSTPRRTSPASTSASASPAS